MKAVGMENCETLEEIWMISSSNVLSKESPMFGDPMVAGQSWTIVISPRIYLSNIGHWTGNTGRGQALDI